METVDAAEVRAQRRGDAHRAVRLLVVLEQRDDGELLRDINTPESLMMSRQVGEAVNSAMDALGDDLKTAITLREIDGLSYEEIASAMNCPVGTVRSRIFRAV